MTKTPAATKTEVKAEQTKAPDRSVPDKPEKVTRPKLDEGLIDSVASANAKLTKQGETEERLEVRLEKGKPEFWWVRPVRLRKATHDEELWLRKH